MKEKIVVAVLSALMGGALGQVFTAANTAGRLTSVEKTLERIEVRLDQLTNRAPR